jgi:radical SAM superfamily enzyme YgiQ (UPF0313 family)
MRLYLVNPSNPLVSIVKIKESRWNRYRVWKPLSLMVLAGLTPPEWEISILDENLGVPDYRAMPRPDLVGITAFTSQANRAYEVATHFRRLGVPVVMGGIHATMCLDEVMERVDSVVTGEAEGIWSQVLEDARNGSLKGRDLCASVRRVQRHGILVAASFIIGLNIDEPGIGKRIAEVASRYGVDNLNTLFLTPLPGTRLWDQMKSEDRIALDTFPEDWKYYTLTFPVARYKNLSLEGIIGEMISCDRDFYSMPRILRRVWSNLWQRRKPLISAVGNLSYRNNLRLNRKSYADFERQRNRHD